MLSTILLCSSWLFIFINIKRSCAIPLTIFLVLITSGATDRRLVSNAFLPWQIVRFQIQIQGQILVISYTFTWGSQCIITKLSQFIVVLMELLLFLCLFSFSCALRSLSFNFFVRLFFDDKFSSLVTTLLNFATWIRVILCINHPLLLLRLLVIVLILIFQMIFSLITSQWQRCRCLRTDFIIYINTTGHAYFNPSLISLIIKRSWAYFHRFKSEQTAGFLVHGGQIATNRKSFIWKIGFLASERRACIPSTVWILATAFEVFIHADARTHWLVVKKRILLRWRHRLLQATVWLLILGFTFINLLEIGCVSLDGLLFLPRSKNPGIIQMMFLVHVLFRLILSFFLPRFFYLITLLLVIIISLLAWTLI